MSNAARSFTCWRSRAIAGETSRSLISAGSSGPHAQRSRRSAVRTSGSCASGHPSEKLNCDGASVAPSARVRAPRSPFALVVMMASSASGCCCSRECAHAAAAANSSACVCAAKVLPGAAVAVAAGHTRSTIGTAVLAIAASNRSCIGVVSSKPQSTSRCGGNRVPLASPRSSSPSSCAWVTIPRSFSRLAKWSAQRRKACQSGLEVENEAENCRSVAGPSPCECSSCHAREASPASAARFSGLASLISAIVCSHSCCSCQLFSSTTGTLLLQASCCQLVETHALHGSTRGVAQLVTPAAWACCAMRRCSQRAARVFEVRNTSPACARANHGRRLWSNLASRWGTCMTILPCRAAENVDAMCGRRLHGCAVSFQLECATFPLSVGCRAWRFGVRDSAGRAAP